MPKCRPSPQALTDVATSASETSASPSATGLCRQGAGQISAEQLEVPGEEGHEEDLHQPQEVHAEADLLEEDHEGGLHRHQEGLWEEVWVFEEDLSTLLLGHVR